MERTTLTLYKDTPFLDFQNTVHFQNNMERDSYFKSSFVKKEFHLQFNFIRDRGTIKVPMTFGEMNGYNYCSFFSTFENDRLYYAYISEYHYLNDNSIELILLIDPIMTFTQGNFFNELPPVNIIRQHLTKAKKSEYELILKTNDDIIKTTTKRYIANHFYSFKELSCIITASVDFTANFGTVDNPHMRTSAGLVIDKITSPLNIYMIELEKFTELMQYLSDYPWITQNIKSILLVPSAMFTAQNYEPITIIGDGKGETYTGCYIFKDDTITEFGDFLSEFVMTKTAICQLHGLDNLEDMHLLRSEYTTTEFYTYDGQSLILDNAFLPKNGLELGVKTLLGYKNVIAVYPKNYKSDENEKDGNYPAVENGTFLNESLLFNTFNDIPILIDNYNLQLAQGANRRELAQKKLFTSRLSSLVDGKYDYDSVGEKIFNAINLISNVSLNGVGEKISNEYEYYRTQNAEFADLQLSQPTLTEGSYGSSFLIKNNLYGITLKIASPEKNEWTKIKNYYKIFGFQTLLDNTKLDDVDSMSVLNFVQFSGKYLIKNIDISLVKMMQAIFEGGVKLWHYDGTTNPMLQDITQNKMVK